MHIGLFDSGVGGLTVLKELRRHLPKANFTYLGDTARLPYGNKAPETLRKYTQENIDFLDQQAVDVIVIACHSASSIALGMTASEEGTPIFNVITPSCEQAVQTTKNGVIGVMATKATTRSQVYSNFINDLQEDLEVISQACPLLVPLVEEGLMEDEVTEFILKRYLKPLATADTLILGCTHYPILKPQIEALCGAGTTLIDPAESVAQRLEKHPHVNQGSGRLEIYLTDHAPHFLEHAEALLGGLHQAAFLFPNP